MCICLELVVVAAIAQDMEFRLGVFADAVNEWWSTGSLRQLRQATRTHWQSRPIARADALPEEGECVLTFD